MNDDTALTVEQLQAELVALRRRVADLEQAKESHHNNDLQFVATHWQQILAQAPVVIALLARDGTILFINQASPSRTIAEVTGTSVYNYLPSSEAERLRQVLDDVFQLCISQNYETSIARADGTTVWYENRVAPLIEDAVTTAAVFVTTDITERVKVEQALRASEEALRASEEKFRTIADFTGDWEYWIGPNGELRYVSPACERISGYPPEDYYVDPDLLLRIVHPDDRQHFEAHVAAIDAVLLHTMMAEIEFRIVTRSGEIRWISHVCRTVMTAKRFQGRRISNRDITAHARAQQALRESTDALRESRDLANVLLNAPIGAAYLISPAGIVLAVNEPGARRFDLSVAELIGKNVFSFFPPEIANTRREWVEEVVRNRCSVHFEDQRTGYILDNWLYPVFNTAGEVWQVAVFVQDITERARNEAAAIKAARLEVAATLAGGVAHQVNNLMAVVLGYADLLKEDPGQPEASDMLTIIAQAAQRAGDLAQQMLGFAHGGKYHPSRIDLNSTVIEITQLWRQKRSLPPEICIDLQLAPDLWQIEADITQFSQILVNLLTNALEAFPESAGCIRIATTNKLIEQTLSLTSRANIPDSLLPGAYVCLTVQDTGRGMSSTVLSRLFEPFFTTKFQGRGLGLAAAYGIVRNHGGGIVVDSQEGAGSTIAVYLPALASEPVPEPGIPPLPDAGGETILVIDDDDGVCVVTQRLLERLGYQVLTARNGAQGIDVARTHEGPIHLVLLDMDMPIVNGMQAFPLLRAARPHIHIIIFSGYDPDDDVQALLAAGAAAFLRKPLQREALAQAIRRTLDAPDKSKSCQA